MKKLVSGILDFRKNVLPHKLDMFARLANGQQPDVLFIACSDSRVAPNWFASTDPGDLFVIRNVGNLVPPCGDNHHSVAAAIDFSLLNLKIKHIVVCGHSGCGAIHALADGIEKVKSEHLKSWLKNGEHALKYSDTQIRFDSGTSAEDKISQSNVLLQMEHLKSYPIVQKKIQKDNLKIHGWWFEISRGNVYSFIELTKKFELISEEVVSSFEK